MWLTLLLNLVLPLLVKFLESLFAKQGTKAEIAPNKDEFLASVPKSILFHKRKMDVASKLYDQAAAKHQEWLASPVVMASADSSPSQYAKDIADAAKRGLKVSV